MSDKPEKADNEEFKLKELRDLLDRAAASGISERTFSKIMELARQEAQRKGLQHDCD